MACGGDSVHTHTHTHTHTGGGACVFKCLRVSERKCQVLPGTRAGITDQSVSVPCLRFGVAVSHDRCCCLGS